MRRVALLGPLLALVACGPEAPRYRLEPPVPSTAEARRCLSACAAEQAACREPAEARFRACEDRATLLHTACERNAQLDYLTCARANDDDRTSCYRRSCLRPLCPMGAIEACEAAYRDCFAGCGGRVIEDKG